MTPLKGKLNLRRPAPAAAPAPVAVKPTPSPVAPKVVMPEPEPEEIEEVEAPEVVAAEPAKAPKAVRQLPGKIKKPVKAIVEKEDKDRDPLDSYTKVQMKKEFAEVLKTDPKLANRFDFSEITDTDSEALLDVFSAFLESKMATYRKLNFAGIYFHHKTVNPRFGENSNIMGGNGDVGSFGGDISCTSGYTKITVGDKVVGEPKVTKVGKFVDDGNGNIQFVVGDYVKDATGKKTNEFQVDAESTEYFAPFYYKHLENSSSELEHENETKQKRAQKIMDRVSALIK